MSHEPHTNLFVRLFCEHIDCHDPAAVLLLMVFGIVVAICAIAHPFTQNS